MDTSNYFSRRNVVFVLATFICFLWGSSYPAIKNGFAMFAIAPDDIAGKLLFAGWRSLLAGLVLILASAATNQRRLGLSAKNLAEVGVLGLVQTSIMFVFFYIGLAHTSGVSCQQG